MDAGRRRQRPRTEAAIRSNLLILLMILGGPAGAAPVWFCVADEPVEAAAVAQLGRHVRLGSVQAGCDAGGYHARFVAAAGGAHLQVVAPDGSVAVRRVPWLAGPAQALSRTVMADRLGALGVLLDGLLLEHQLAAAPTEPPPPAPTEPPPAAPVEPPAAPPPAAPPSVAPRKIARRPKAPTPEPVAAPASEPPPAPAPEPPFDPGPAPPPEPPPVRVVVLPPPPPRVTITPHSPAFGGVHLDLRWRAPAMLVPQAGLVGGYGPLQATLSWQPALAWAWDGRRYSATSGGLGLDYRVSIRRDRGWRLAAPVGLTVEYAQVERTDVEGSPHGLWQLGVAVGLQGAVQLAESFWLAPTLRGRWAPIGQLSVADGPVVPFNEAGVEVGLGLLLAPGW
ncbi:MAG: hypothetical protein H6706_07060 [Myxococcales bacterium]|nr:hypothetical protein [Myxococcales bacterium]